MNPKTVKVFLGIFLILPVYYFVKVVIMNDKVADYLQGLSFVSISMLIVLSYLLKKGVPKR